jgi:hypothetical protein
MAYNEMAYSDYLLAQLRSQGEISLVNFVHNRTIRIQTIGGSANCVIRTTSKFFLKDLRIYGYDKYGSIYGISNNTRDKFTVQIQNVSTGQNMFEEPIDITKYSPHIAGDTIFPEIIEADQQLSITIYHNAVVYQNAQIDTELKSPINVEFQISLIGAKFLK